MRIPHVPLLSIIFCYCFFIHHSVHFTVVFGQIVEDQQQSLLKLKNSLEFKNQMSHKLVSWNSSIDSCEWRGVTCDEEGHVIGLDLSGESISGGFDDSSTLFSLQNLQTLNLSANNFSSEIPSGFNKLNNLTYLNLSHAGFVGQIPIEISYLTRLVTLDISSVSYLYGQPLKLENIDIQMLVQNLTMIRQLYMDGVSVRGQGNKWSNALLQLINLQELSMSNCNLSGPLDTSLTRLKNLSIIRLDQNNLSSTVPEAFANFPNLTTLHLSSCGLTGTFPEKIFTIATLSDIDLSFNHDLYGSLPEFPLKSPLHTLIVSHTRFSRALPAFISNLRQLSILDLSYCQFNRTLPSSLSALLELTFLDLLSNNFTGPIPSLNMSQNLKHLDLSGNNIHGFIPTWIWQLDSLVQLNLSHNMLSNLAEPVQQTSSTLKVLDLHSNQLQGKLPIFPVNAIYLDYSSNNFSFTVPSDVGTHQSSIVFLSLSNNNLSGNILQSLCNNSNLLVLELSHNHFNGPIPEFLTQSETLVVLNLQHNDFDGSIPGEFPASCALTILDLSSNILKGPIPKSLANCTSLEVLNLGNNLVDDEFPYFLNSISTLSVMILRENKLHGNIECPQTNNNNSRHMLQIVDVSFNNFSGSLPAKCFKSQLELTKVSKILNAFSAVDFSSNNFEGTIPEELMNLTSLISLNLSHNALSGQIPSCMGNLKQLKSLDLLDTKVKNNNSQLK